MSFQENLKFYREKAGYKSAREVAEALSLPYNTYAGYESKGREPKYQTLCKIADLLNVSLDDLLGRKNNILGKKDKDEIQEVIRAIEDCSEDCFAASYGRGLSDKLKIKFMYATDKVLSFEIFIERNKKIIGQGEISKDTFIKIVHRSVRRAEVYKPNDILSNVLTYLLNDVGKKIDDDLKLLQPFSSQGSILKNAGTNKEISAEQKAKIFEKNKERMQTLFHQRMTVKRVKADRTLDAILHSLMLRITHADSK